MNIKKILVPVDLEWPVFPAVAEAARLARHFGAEIVMLYAVAPATFLGIELGHSKHLLERGQHEEASVNTKIAPLLEGITYERLVLFGEPSHVILETAQKRGADLIVMAPHAQGYALRLLDSVTYNILNGTTTPVWTVPVSDQPVAHPETIPVTPLDIRTIVCGVDFTPHDDHVVQVAADAAQTFGSRLVLVHAAPGVEIYGPGGYHEVVALKERLHRASSERMETLIAKCGVQAEPHIGYGKVHKVLEAAAREYQASLVVIGCRATKGMPGGHAYQIILHSERAVLGV